MNPRYKRDLTKNKGFHGRNGKYEPLTRNDLIMCSSGEKIIHVQHVNTCLQRKHISSNSYCRLDESDRC